LTTPALKGAKKKKNSHPLGLG